jgi:hypothetical protein
MPKSSSLAKRLLGIVNNQKQLLRQLEALARQESVGEKSEGEELVASLWRETLETLQGAVETIEDLAWAADPDGMAKETVQR